jgi:hypothetical protein
MMRSTDYACTPPEAPAGFAVFELRLVFVIIAAQPMCCPDRRQQLSNRICQSGGKSKIRFSKVESDIVVTR